MARTREKLSPHLELVGKEPARLRGELALLFGAHERVVGQGLVRGRRDYYRRRGRWYEMTAMSRSRVCRVVTRDRAKVLGALAGEVLKVG